MGLQIESGTGNAFTAGVDSTNRILTRSVTNPQTNFVNRTYSQTYSWVIEATPTTGAPRCFAYLKNNSSDQYLVINSLKMSAAGAETVQLKLRDVLVGSLAGGAAGTAINRNTDSANVANATIYSGNAVTGSTSLTGGAVVDEFQVFAAANTIRYSWDSGLILGSNGILTLYSVLSNVALKLTFGFYFWPYKI